MILFYPWNCYFLPILSALWFCTLGLPTMFKASPISISDVGIACNAEWVDSSIKAKAGPAASFHSPVCTLLIMKGTQERYMGNWGWVDYISLYTYTESSKNEKLEYKGNMAPWGKIPIAVLCATFCLSFHSTLISASPSPLSLESGLYQPCLPGLYCSGPWPTLFWFPSVTLSHWYTFLFTAQMLWFKLLLGSGDGSVSKVLAT